MLKELPALPPDAESESSMASAPYAAPGAFSIGQARNIVKDLFTPNQFIYWTDLLLSMTIGIVAFQAVRRGRLVNYLCEVSGIEWPGFRWGLYTLFFFIACLAFYRAALFTHELVHRRDNFRAFRMAWNLMCGIPFLMPSFLYETHIFHHMRKEYGTHEDGEYLPLGRGPVRMIFLYLASSLVIPLLSILRFGILAPASWASPRLRDLIHRRASSMVIDPRYLRPLPTRNQMLVWRLQEIGCFFYILLMASLLLLQVVPWMWLVQVYLTGVTIITFNAIRTLGAHRYRNAGGEMSFMEQLLDSINYPNNPVISGLWAPVGLRFHALHHLFPSMPYHALAKGHRRLMAELPSDSPYRLTESPGLLASLKQLVRDARASSTAR